MVNQIVKNNKRAFSYICIVVILLSLILSACGSSVNSSTNAKICAEKAVSDSLKSPSTAKFCKYTDMIATDLGGNRWKVSGYVDAQNSFGATVRTNWTVTLTLTNSGFKDYDVKFS